MNINIMQTKSISYDELLALRPNNAERYSHGKTFNDIANYIIENHAGSIVDYGEESNTFAAQHNSLIDSWDYGKVKPLDLTVSNGGYRVRDGSHRCIIIAVQVKRGELVYQDISVEITDYQDTYVDITNLGTFLTDHWVSLYSETEYRSNLRIKLFNTDIDNNDFDTKMSSLRTEVQSVLDAQTEVIRNRMVPIILKCHWHNDDSGKSYKSEWVTVDN